MEDLMKLKQRKISVSKDIKILLNEQTLFLANGDEGLHLWESSVVFARYILSNPSIFENKKIIELGTGCGLLGLVALLHTKLDNIIFSDYQQSVLDNLSNNIKINTNSNMDGKYSILNLDWRDYDKFKLESFDFVIGSELIYSGGHIEELAKLIRNLLKIDGVALIAMPEKRSMTKPFLEYLNLNELTASYKYMSDYNIDLFENVLENEKESKKLFENLKNMNIMLYEIRRINNVIY
jgi:predicted nicotinamide N-methyase